MDLGIHAEHLRMNSKLQSYLKIEIAAATPQSQPLDSVQGGSASAGASPLFSPRNACRKPPEKRPVKAPDERESLDQLAALQ